MREAGDVCFADVFKDGTGVVEFLRYEDMKYAFKKLDDSRFRSHEASIKWKYTASLVHSCNCLQFENTLVLMGKTIYTVVLVFWVGCLCALVGRYQHFGETYCLHL
jgi:hypothetical protein